MLRALIFAALLAAFVVPARAHDWYTNRRDPLYGRLHTCCGGSDCNVVSPEYITILPDGRLHVEIPIGVARAINPKRQDPVDVILPFERLQDSEVNSWAICLKEHDTPQDYEQGVYCIFAPPGT